MYGNFTWWQGVVEDRNDPLKLGRCRVRVFGYHTDNKSPTSYYSIPTKSLPWATPMQPITSAAMNGIGTTPMGPVEGTWVFGFWRDGSNAQEPVIIGTVGGKMEKDHKKDPSKGFNDPKGKYPRDENIGEPDTNRLARGIGGTKTGTKNSEDSKSLTNKRAKRNRGDPDVAGSVTNTGIAKGRAGDMTGGDGKKATIDNRTGDDAGHYNHEWWNEPNPRYGGTAESDTTYLTSVENLSQYPYCHVRMSESGHVEEWDDTETAERLHRYHKTGTFEEIQPDGSRVVKVVADDYEIVAGSKNVAISGVCNLTIKGDCRVLYMADLVQEVRGDYHLHVHKDMRTKIHGNEITEVITDRKTVINGQDDLFVAKNQTINIGDNKTITVGGNLKDTVKKDVDSLYGYNTGDTPGHHTINVAGLANYNVDDAYTIFCKDDIKITTLEDLDMIVTKDYHQEVGVDSLIQVSGEATETITGAVSEVYSSTWTNVTTDASSWQGTNGNITITAPEIQLNP